MPKPVVDWFVLSLVDFVDIRMFLMKTTFTEQDSKSNDCEKSKKGKVGEHI